MRRKECEIRVDRKDYSSTSKFLAMVLRHKPEKAGVRLDKHGWANVEKLIEGVNTAGKYHLDKEILQEIVRTNDKQRFSFSEDGMKIRANQGHSIAVDVELKKKIPPGILYHGIGEKYVTEIQKHGLIHKNRLYVHLSMNQKTAVSVGARHGKPVVFQVDAASMWRDGLLFFESVNHVWLTEYVPVKYLQKL